MMKVVVAGGGWSTNVGNAFFNLGTLHALRTVLPDVDVFLLSDQPGNLDFVRRRSPRNSLNIFNYLDADLVVLHGSVLTRYLPRVWAESFRKLRDRGAKVAFIGSGLFEYSKAEIQICRDFLKQYPPFVFMARDSETYQHFHDLAEHSYDGIDCAFFLPEAFTPTGLGLPPYFILNFDKSPEPSIACLANGNCAGLPAAPATNGVAQFELNSKHWGISFPRFRGHLARRLHKFYPYVESLIPLQAARPESVGGQMIVRADHQFNPICLRKMFRSPNSFCWDLPEPYLCLYANADLTLTDRIHAALVTLAYGKPAMLFSSSGRARILERVGISGIDKKPVYLDQSRVAQERDKMLRFLGQVSF